MRYELNFFIRFMRFSRFKFWKYTRVIRNTKQQHCRHSLKFDGSNFILLEWRTAFLEKDTATWIAQNLSALTEFGSLLSCSQNSTILVWQYSEAANKYCQYYCTCGKRMGLQLQLNYWYWKIKAIVSLTTRWERKTYTVKGSTNHIDS